MRGIICFLFVFFTVAEVFGQKFGYIDSKYIMSQMSAYKEAKAEIDKLSQDWQEEILSEQREIDKLYSELKAEEVLLTAEMKQERLKVIQEKEKALKVHQKKVFGMDGLFFLKQQELIKPVQDDVFEAVEKVSKNNRIQIMFDKSGDLVMLYTDPVHDYTDFVLEELGLGDSNDTIEE